MPIKKKASARGEGYKMRPFLVYAKFVNVGGEQSLQAWTGMAQSLGVAMRRASVVLWKNPTVRGKHYVRVVLMAEPVSEKDWEAMRKHRERTT
jgi:hypothetical protein